ncbi:hypothetical protein HF313_24670 [Massilia atriviolacea]|uniref:Uncharacterized protein n=1 Tax=Massilia atriviolacea TaxID=2495579 RepID=A0A430HJT8_9BURK|nr:hypothetical protein [Massilia atriviolacea]RSZ57797.1 hypothetical protein EJB06_15815 [Massilia atriviolacea]
MTNKIAAVARVSSNEMSGCSFCSHSIDGTMDFAAGVNHYLTAHACTLLHVGQEDVAGRDGKPWATTVALLGAW